VREGRTNVLSTCAFVSVTGKPLRQPGEFMEACAELFKPEIEEGPATKKCKS
jgi:hypothetical protein